MARDGEFRRTWERARVLESLAILFQPKQRLRRKLNGEKLRIPTSTGAFKNY